MDAINGQFDRNTATHDQLTWYLIRRDDKT
jgi:hypothetical protein